MTTAIYAPGKEEAQILNKAAIELKTKTWHELIVENVVELVIRTISSIVEMKCVLDVLVLEKYIAQTHH
ncbi:hypothetical protein [Pricia antarctica]|nr:hypothetical protein [Pricia antarctica]